MSIEKDRASAYMSILHHCFICLNTLPRFAVRSSMSWSSMKPGDSAYLKKKEWGLSHLCAFTELFGPP